MSEHTLIDKIKADAAKEVSAIKEAGAAEVAAIERATEGVLEAKRAAHKIALDKKLAQLELVAVSKAKQASKIALQSAKRAEIDSLFTEVATELSKLSREDYVTLFTKYATEIIPEGVAAVAVHTPADRQEETAAVLKARGVSCDLAVDPKISAGFVLSTKDGVYDVTLARIMGEARAELEMDVVSKVQI